MGNPQHLLTPRIYSGFTEDPALLPFIRLIHATLKAGHCVGFPAIIAHLCNLQVLIGAHLTIHPPLPKEGA